MSWSRRNRWNTSTMFEDAAHILWYGVTSNGFLWGCLFDLPIFVDVRTHGRRFENCHGILTLLFQDYLSWKLFEEEQTSRHDNAPVSKRQFTRRPEHVPSLQPLRRCLNTAAYPCTWKGYGQIWVINLLESSVASTTFKTQNNTQNTILLMMSLGILIHENSNQAPLTRFSNWGTRFEVFKHSFENTFHLTGRAGRRVRVPLIPWGISTQELVLDRGRTN